MIRNVLAASLGAALLVSAFAPTEVSAAPKKPGGAGICVTKPQPECNLILKAVCTKKSKCGGCLEWVCKL